MALDSTGGVHVRDGEEQRLLEVASERGFFAGEGQERRDADHSSEVQ